MNHNFHAEYNNIRIRPLAVDDIELLRVWRNDADYSRYITKIPFITPEMQQKWFEKYLVDSDVCTWAIDEISELNRFVGTTSLYSFREGICEIGKTLIDSEASGRGIGSLSETLCMHIGFKKYNVNKIDAHIDINNIAAIKKAEKDGLIIQNQICHEGIMNYYFIAEEDDFYKKHSFLCDVAVEEE